MNGFFWEPMPLRCIEGTVWGGGGCTANALELPPPCVEPPMYPDVIEGCTSIGPESILLSRRWPDVGAIHLRCQKCYQYAILTHCSLVCNNYNRIVNQIISGYECFSHFGFFWEPTEMYLRGRCGAAVAALLTHWSYRRPVSNHQCIRTSLRVAPASGQNRYCYPDVGPMLEPSIFVVKNVANMLY